MSGMTITRRVVLVVTLLAAAAAIAAMAVFKVTCFDVWWHLKTGEYILTHRTVPVTDIFSYTVQGHTWITHEWLFEVILFLVYRLGALNGIIFLNAAIVLLGFVFTALLLRRLRVELWVGAPLVLLAAFLVTFRAFCRPHIVTECLLALYLLVLLGYKYSPQIRASRKWLWLLLAVQFVWANSHSGSVLGIGLFALFIAAEAAQGRLGRKGVLNADWVLAGSDLRFLTWLGLALLGVSFINPNLHRSLLYSVTIMREPILAGGIRELQTPFQAAFRHADLLVSFVVLLGLGAASFVLNRRRIQLFHLAVFLASGLAGCLALRNLPIFGLLSVPVVALNCQQLLKPGRRTWLNAAAALLALGVLVMVFTRGVQVGAERRKPSLGYDARVFPVEAADFVEQAGIKEHVFSTMEYGGYFIWRWYPERRVFIDGRVDPYGAEFFRLYGRMLASSAAFDSVVAAYDINCCVLPAPPSNTPATARYLGRTLAERPGWALVYWDDLALVYVRDIPEHAELIRTHAYHALVPTLLGLPEGSQAEEPGFLTALESEAERAVEENPGSRLARVLFGAVKMRLGSPAEAGAAFRQALSSDPDNVEALTGLALLHARTQEYPEARRLLERAARLEPQNGIVLVNLGLVLHRLKNDAEAARVLERAVEIDPGQVLAYVTLGDIYLAQGLRDVAREVWERALAVAPGSAAIQKRLSELQSDK
jgi:Tfp pilus assembly protein PilF